MTRHRAPAALVAALSLTLVTACGDDDDDAGDAVSTEADGTEAPAAGADTTEAPAAGADTTEAPTADGGAEIVISGFAFSDPITVPAGTTVTVRNNDSATHTWTADDGSFNSEAIDPGETFEFTFDEAGEFPFHCDFHPSMAGSVTVTG